MGKEVIFLGVHHKVYFQKVDKSQDATVTVSNLQVETQGLHPSCVQQPVPQNS
jgi:hypothetical protein